MFAVSFAKQTHPHAYIVCCDGMPMKSSKHWQALSEKPGPGETLHGPLALKALKVNAVILPSSTVRVHLCSIGYFSCLRLRTRLLCCSLAVLHPYVFAYYIACDALMRKSFSYKAMHITSCFASSNTRAALNRLVK